MAYKTTEELLLKLFELEDQDFADFKELNDRQGTAKSGLTALLDVVAMMRARPGQLIGVLSEMQEARDG